MSKNMQEAYNEDGGDTLSFSLDMEKVHTDASELLRTLHSGDEAPTHQEAAFVVAVLAVATGYAGGMAGADPADITNAVGQAYNSVRDVVKGFLPDTTP